MMRLMRSCDENEADTVGSASFATEAVKTGDLYSQFIFFLFCQAHYPAAARRNTLCHQAAHGLFFYLRRRKGFSRALSNGAVN